ncbi:BREX-6 system adenine-specific DNA-methyltransferase PglX [Nodosilinea sp. LEGE 06152]|uniref:BREX-6 system adenine-specific DNA-methyltransferase PglX n=1 Tax=Nodosilinea sp. LEGE 06152 TaxID=2777966 RepID=UPI001881F2E0|nr:BREX-6 system adenine-specific DNA-methyltransferase PglX [Nodosilinea sp. LEGE 06152]MBE9160039.1 BREX-6 system adenine-specific DNA-methyltransferase PglX [Nodosilinea sp. LEGE 06152]
MSQLTSDAKIKLSATIRRLRSGLLEALHNGVESTYRLSLSVDKAGLAQEHLIKRQRLEQWLEEQVRAETGGNATKAWQRHRQSAEKLAAATLLNRLVVIKQMEAMGLIRPMVVTGGWQSKGYREFRESAPDLCRDETEGFGTLLKLMYDELALEMPGLFGKVGITSLIPIPPSALRLVVEALDAPALAAAWQDDTTLGWVYQYWNDPEREALDAKLNKGGKVEPHEIASKTQMFTERYMVEWLLHNSLGQQWLAICHQNGWVPEVEADGTLTRLEERRKIWREKRERGEVALDELMPTETEQEERWKYWVPQPALAPLSQSGKGAGGEGKASIRDLKTFDPACGSGHFLVIAFGLLFAFYQEEARHRGVGWSDQEIVEAIAENNLHGLDLDPRAVQIAAAALYLKAKALCPKAKLKVVNLVASNLNLAALPENDPALVELRHEVTLATGIPEELTNRIVHGLKGADTWGSLLKVDKAVDDAIRDYGRGLWRQRQTSAFDADYKAVPDDPNGSAKINLAGLTADEQQQLKESLQERIEKFLAQHTRSDDLGLRLRGEQLAAGVRFLRLVREGSYDLVIGNPPYQGTSKMQDARYVAVHYPLAKADLYAAFLQRGLELAKLGGLSALLTMRNWMFINQFSNIREFLIDIYDLRILGDIDRGGFEDIPDEVVSTVMSVFRRADPTEEPSIATQPTPLDDNTRDNQRTNRKRAAMLAQVGRYEFQTQHLNIIKKKPFVYWWNKSSLVSYAESTKIESDSPARKGINTGDNLRFLRHPFEVDLSSTSCTRFFKKSQSEYQFFYTWHPYIKGAAGKKWFEDLQWIVNWKNSGLEIKILATTGLGANIRNESYFFRPGVAFSMIGSGFSGRLHRYPSVIDGKGSSIYSDQPNNTVCLLNSKVSKQVMASLNPGIGFEIGDVNRLPLFPIESADEILAQLDRAFTEHEAARETSVEFKQPGPSCWAYAQDWAQRAVDRESGEPLPEWQPVYVPPSAQSWVSYAVGVALGRFPLNSLSSPPAPTHATEPEPESEALPHGILYLSAYSGSRTDSIDSLNHPAAQPIHAAWAKYGGAIARGKTLHDWLRLNFFPDVHLKLYGTKDAKRPIYFPLSSANKNFVAFINIHRWSTNTLQTLLADYLLQDLRNLEGETADLLDSIGQGDSKQQSKTEERRTLVQALYTELQTFVDRVRQCAEQGPPAAHPSDPLRQANAPFSMDLDDGVMINSAALWPLLEPQWSKPKAWWSELCKAEGKKDYDWSHLAACYFPARVDEKCQIDPSLAVAHGVFWKYHTAKAYEWELRLQDEIGPDCTIDEDGSNDLRQAFEADHPDQVTALKEKEAKRRERKYKKQAEGQLALSIEEE